MAIYSIKVPFHRLKFRLFHFPLKISSNLSLEFDNLSFRLLLYLKKAFRQNVAEQTHKKHVHQGDFSKQKPFSFRLLSFSNSSSSSFSVLRCRWSPTDDIRGNDGRVSLSIGLTFNGDFGTLSK